MVFLDKYDQCNACSLRQMCLYSRDYYMYKGGKYRQYLNVDNEGNCSYAPFNREQSSNYGKVSK